MSATFYATIDSDSIRDYMPTVPVLLPVSSWVRKAVIGLDKRVVGAIPVPKLPDHLTDVEKGADGGGFVAARVWGGEYRFTTAQYVAWLRGWKPTWAAMLDYCVEPLIADTPEKVRERQLKTTANAQAIWDEYQHEPWAWVPTVQGWTLRDYVRHAKELRPLITEMQEYYTSLNIPGFRVGIGTLCCRTSRKQIEAIIAAVAEALPGVPLHLWGVKLDLFKSDVALHAQVVSTDSAAWSGRFGTDIEKYRGSGLTQRQHAYTIALPEYRGKINHAKAKPKQLAMDLPSNIIDWDSLAKALKGLFTCPGCETTFDDDQWDCLCDDPESQEDIIAHLLLGVCPICQAPLKTSEIRADYRRKPLQRHPWENIDMTWWRQEKKAA